MDLQLGLQEAIFKTGSVGVHFNFLYGVQRDFGLLLGVAQSVLNQMTCERGLP